MATAAFLAGKCALHNRMGNLQEVAQLYILLESGVIDMRIIADIAMFVFFIQRIEFGAGLGKLCFVAEYTGLVPHGINHGIADFRHALVAFPAAGRYLIESRFPLVAGLGEAVLTAYIGVGFGKFSGTVTGGMAKYQHFRQGVCA